MELTVESVHAPLQQVVLVSLSVLVLDCVSPKPYRVFRLSGIIIYLVTNIVELIPSPFNGVCGFEHLRLKELKNGVVFVFVFLYFQKNFKSKLQLLYDNIGM